MKSKNFIVFVLVEIFVSFSVASLCVAIERVFDFSLYSVSIVFVIPMGAMLLGCLSSAGFNLAAIGLKIEVTRPILMLSMLISALSFGFIYLIKYYSQTEYDVFSMFFDDSVQNMTLDFFSRSGRNLSTGNIGSFGYVFVVLQILGFAFAGPVALSTNTFHLRK